MNETPPKAIDDIHKIVGKLSDVVDDCMKAGYGARVITSSFMVAYIRLLGMGSTSEQDIVKIFNGFATPEFQANAITEIRKVRKFFDEELDKKDG